MKIPYRRNWPDHIVAIKKVHPSYASAFAQAVIEEVKNTLGLSGDFFYFEPAGVKMGEFGVGSRGKGDFFAHRQIARVIGKTSASVGVDEMDEPGRYVPEGIISSALLMACIPAFRLSFPCRISM